jgi:hypothetical protein
MMKKLSVLFLVLISFHTNKAASQTNWPMHHNDTVPTVINPPCDCAKVGIGLVVGHPLLASFSQDATWNPQISGSPYSAFNSISQIGWSPEIGLFFIVRPKEWIGIYLESQFSRIRVTENSLANGATQDLSPQGGGNIVVGNVNVSDIWGTVDYLRNSLGAQIHFNVIGVPLYFNPFISIRQSLNNLTFHYTATVDQPSGATFPAVNQTSLPEDYTVQETTKFNAGFGAGLGWEFILSPVLIGQFELTGTYYIGTAADDGTLLDLSRELDPVGPSTASFSNRTLEFPLGLSLKIIWMP